MIVNWESLEAPMMLGGLGVGNLNLKNLGLLTKWWWEFSCDSNPLWKKVLMSTNSLVSQFSSMDNILARSLG